MASTGDGLNPKIKRNLNAYGHADQYFHSGNEIANEEATAVRAAAVQATLAQVWPSTGGHRHVLLDEGGGSPVVGRLTWSERTGTSLPSQGDIEQPSFVFERGGVSFLVFDRFAGSRCQMERPPGARLDGFAAWLG